MQRQPKMQCDWNNCAREFLDTEDYRRHYARHIKARIAVALGKPKMLHLPAETWAGVLPSCDRQSLAQRISLTRRQFHAIARPLMDGPKGRVLPKMTFLKFWGWEGCDSVLLKCIENVDGTDGHHLMEVPVADVPPPQSVVGFSQIVLNCLDAKVLSFLWCIRHLFANVFLELATDCCPLWSSAANRHLYRPLDGSPQRNLAALECLLRVFPHLDQAITSLCVLSGGEFIAPDLLTRLLANVRHLRIQSAPPMPEWLYLTGTYSRNCSPYIPVLLKWLHSPTEDGRQKMAYLNLCNIENLSALVTQAQQHFTSARSTPIPYIMGVYSLVFNSESVQLPFTTLHNECTGETLTLRLCSVPHFIERVIFLCRDQSAGAPEWLATREAFAQTMFSNESRNKLVLNVGQMSEIDESLFPADSEDEQDEPQDVLMRE